MLVLAGAGCEVKSEPVSNIPAIDACNRIKDDRTHDRCLEKVAEWLRPTPVPTPG